MLKLTTTHVDAPRITRTRTRSDAQSVVDKLVEEAWALCTGEDFTLAKCPAVELALPEVEAFEKALRSAAAFHGKALKLYDYMASKKEGHVLVTFTVKDKRPRKSKTDAASPSA
jgi:hypothetical protein